MTSNLYVNLDGTVSPSFTLTKDTLFFPLACAAVGASTAPTAAAADVWSMGATLYLMTVGVYPFEDQRNPRDMCATLKNVLAGRYRPLRPGLLSAECEDLLGRMLVPRPADRITLAEVAQHPWVACVDDLPPAAPPRSAP